MVSRENTVVIACVAAAIVLYFAMFVQELVVVEDWLAMGVLLGVGVVLPQLLNEYLDSASARDTSE